MGLHSVRRRPQQAGWKQKGDATLERVLCLPRDQGTRYVFCQVYEFPPLLHFYTQLQLDFLMWFPCPGGKHTPIPEDWEWTLDRNGNPRGAIPFPSECPLNCVELKSRRKVGNKWCLFSKWTKTTQNWVSNHGDPASLAIDWFVWQGYSGPRFDRNSGRMSLARWLAELHVPYHESHQVHGDLIDVQSRLF